MIRVFAKKVSGLDFSGGKWDRYLSPERRRLAQRYKNSRERQLFLGAEVLLNQSLETVQGNISIPAAYTRNSYGKPCLEEDGIYVNWSHSREYVLCAVAAQEVGVDLQYNQVSPKENLVRRVLRVPEMKIYQSLDEDGRKKCFYEFWTVKESFLKALGTGFCTPLERFCVHREDGGLRIIQDINEKVYSCMLLDFLDKDYTAAVCCEGNLGRVRIEYL